MDEISMLKDHTIQRDQSALKFDNTYVDSAIKLPSGLKHMGNSKTSISFGLFGISKLPQKIEFEDYSNDFLKSDKRNMTL